MSVMYGDEMQAVATFLAGLQKLCVDTKLDVAGDAEGIAVYFGDEILGYIGMHEDAAYSFKSLESAERQR